MFVERDTALLPVYLTPLPVVLWRTAHSYHTIGCKQAALPHRCHGIVIGLFWRSVSSVASRNVKLCILPIQCVCVVCVCVFRLNLTKKNLFFSQYGIASLIFLLGTVEFEPKFEIRTFWDNSNVRHPRCVLYDSKQLGYVNTYSRTQLYLLLYYRSLQQRHVSALYVGHHQVVVGLSA